MKKSIAGIMICSALLLPNNNSVEASSSNNNVEVQKVQYIECVGWDGKLVDFSSKLLKSNNFQLDFKNSLAKYLEEVIAASKPVEKPVNKPSTPNVEQAPEVEQVPEVKPVPETTPVPEAKPEPETTPAPEAKPEPETNPAPEANPKPETTPVPEAKPEPETNPAPEANPEPETNPTPEVAPKPEATPTPTPTPTPEKPSTPVEAAPNASVSAVEKAVLDLTNAERQKAGLAPLQTDSNLMKSARQKSTDMATNNYFSHTSPTHGSPFDQMKANGVSYKSAAENIAMGQRTAEAVVKGWMDSPGHRQNILTADYTHIGIGYDTNGHYWTQQFIGK